MKVRCDTPVVLIPIKDLKLNPNNRNKHPKEQIERLAKILAANGWRYPVKVSNQSKMVTSGHGRIEAAALNKWKKVPVQYQDYDSPEEEYADSIADNAIASWAELDTSGITKDVGEFDGRIDIELLGMKDFTLVDADTLDPQCDEDAVPEHVEPKSKLGDMYALGRHRLMCGDSTSLDAVEKLMNGEKVDMVFTDPPYGIDEETDRAFRAFRNRKCKANTFPKIIGDDSIDTSISAFAISESMSEIVCFWGGNYYAHKLPPSACWIVWDKRVDENQRDFNSDCELAYVKHSNKKSVRIFRHLWKGMIKGSENGQGRVHPTQKPIALSDWVFNEFIPQGRSVLDLFGGSGSTLIACEKTNRKCFMMEIDTHYCDVIVARWEKYTGKKAELVNG